MKIKKELKQILDETETPFFLTNSTVLYNDDYFKLGIVKMVLPYLEQNESKELKGYSIKILVDNGINHNIEIVSNCEIFHYLQNEKNSHFNKTINFVYNK